MEHTFEVTQEDINAGEIGGCSNCPIALAIKRVLPELEVSVTNDNVVCWEKDDRKLRHWDFTSMKIRFPLTDEIKIFVRTFDMGYAKRLKPFSFSITSAPELFNQANEFHNHKIIN